MTLDRIGSDYNVKKSKGCEAVGSRTVNNSDPIQRDMTEYSVGTCYR
jgi:hypothetical protein